MNEGASPLASGRSEEKKINCLRSRSFRAVASGLRVTGMVQWIIFNSEKSCADPVSATTEPPWQEKSVLTGLATV